MIIVTIIIGVLVLICCLKTKKIKELYKNLKNKESMFIVLYEQKFETLLKLVQKDSLYIQESLIMDIAEMRKQSLFNLKQNNIKSFILIEEKIEKLLKNVNTKEILNLQQNKNLSEVQGETTAENFDDINTLIEETKSDYNNLLDHFNQETSDFFGKQIIKQMKNLKQFQRV